MMLATRVASAAVFGPVLVLAGYFGGPLLWLVTGFVVVAGLVEMDRLLRQLGLGVPVTLAAPLGLGLVGLAAAGRTDLGPAVMALGTLALVMAPAVSPSRLRGTDGVGGVFGLVYPSWLASHLVLLRQAPGGLAAFFVALIGTWVFDSASYFAGRAWGRHKLAPRVSPGKSVEGLVGGAVVGGVVIVWLAVAWLDLGFGVATVLALSLMTAAQLGDLAESALKRQSGVKDSGTLIPGHGGVLDRFDSLLAVMPTVYYLWVLWLGA